MGEDIVSTILKINDITSDGYQALPAIHKRLFHASTHCTCHHLAATPAICPICHRASPPPSDAIQGRVSSPLQGTTCHPHPPAQDTFDAILVLIQMSSSSRCLACAQDSPHPDVSLIGGSSLSRCHPHPVALHLPHGGQAPSRVPVAVLISIFTPLEITLQGNRVRYQQIQQIDARKRREGLI